MIAIIDYGVGNLFSLRASLERIGAKAAVTSDKAEIGRSDRIILPGVGAFEDAANKLRTSGLADVVLDEVKKGKPLMGICLGMQLLFERSYEFGCHEGLGLIKGSVKSLEGAIPPNLKIPQIGWNRLEIVRPECPIFKYSADGDYVYFVHSYFAQGCDDALAAVADYGIPITAAVEKDHIFGCQFHPEKSGTVGLTILEHFCGI